jgi:hypothetical protein
VDNTDLSQSFSYKSGFKVGFGFIVNHEWVIDTKYTWIGGTNTLDQRAPSSPTLTSGTATALSGTPVWVVQDWFIQPTSNGQALSGTRVSSNWHYILDLFDVVLSPSYNSQPLLTITPFAGLRAALIQQKLNIALTEIGGQTGITLTPQPIHSRNKSSSWGIGPRLGFEADCNLPRGFRLIGDLAASLLYTRYTKIVHKEDSASTTFNPGPYTFQYHDYNCLRPIAELGLGFGWGGTSKCKRYRWDFSASYDFNLFWSQNMMNKMLTEFLNGTTGYAGDLYFHGMTLSGCFSF